MSSITSPTRWPKRRERSTSAASASWKRRRLDRPGQLVGDRLALDGLVQADVLDRHGRLAGEVVEQLALVVAERAARCAADRDDAGHRAGALARRVQRVGQRADAVDASTLARLAGLEQHLRLGRARRAAASAVELPGRGDLLERPVGGPAHRRAAAVGADAVDGGAARRSPAARRGRGSRRTSSPMRRIALRRRARSCAQLVQPRLELRGHLVELLAELGELVAAVGRHLGGEVAAAEPARRAPGSADLALQRARHEHART